MKKWIVNLAIIVIISLTGCANEEAASVGVIGGADGPTAIYLGEEGTVVEFVGSGNMEKLSEEDGEELSQLLLLSSSWQEELEKSIDEINLFFENGEAYSYQLESGIFNDNINSRHLILSEDDRTRVNELLSNYAE